MTLQAKSPERESPHTVNATGNRPSAATLTAV